jgi:hypothetical protein
MRHLFPAYEKEWLSMDLSPVYISSIPILSRTEFIRNLLNQLSHFSLADSPITLPTVAFAKFGLQHVPCLQDVQQRLQLITVKW